VIVFAKIIRHDSSQLLGRSHYEVFPDIPENWKEMHLRALQGEIVRAEEDQWNRKDGTVCGALGDSSLEDVQRICRRDSDFR
jgi:hypothetical protein